MTVDQTPIANRDQVEPRPGSKQVIDAVTEAFGFSWQEICGQRRHKPVAEARHVAAYLLHAVGGISLTGTGHILGGRDHTTILHSVGRVKAWLTDGSLSGDRVSRLANRLRSSGGYETRPRFGSRTWEQSEPINPMRISARDDPTEASRELERMPLVRERRTADRAEGEE